MKRRSGKKKMGKLKTTEYSEIKRMTRTKEKNINRGEMRGRIHAKGTKQR